jgi:hypothetical protein
LAGKTRWQLHGGRADIIDWVKSAHHQRYGGLYEGFLQRTGNELVTPSQPDCAPLYSFSNASVEKSLKTKNPKQVGAGLRNSATSSSSKLIETMRPHVQKRLLGRNVTLHITMAGKRFLVPHDALWQWVELETNVSNTKSWQELGHYHWPTPSVQMLHFLGDFKIADCANASHFTAHSTL